MATDYNMLRKGLASISDFQKLQEEFDLKKKLMQAQTMEAQKKLTQVDVDKLGEQAFMKAAMGQQLSPEEQAAAMFIDAKSGGQSFNPVTGEIVQRPRISDKIGLPGMTQSPQPRMGGGAVDVADLGVVPQITEQDLQGYTPMQGVNAPPPIPVGGVSRMNPKEKMSLTQENIKSDRTRLDEVIAASGSASSAKSSARRMQELQKDLGYTGFGATPLALADKILTGMGAGGFISGSPAAREAFGRESVDQWVKAVEPLKGALTEREGARFDAAVPNLSMTPEGIKKMNELTVALGKRAQEKSEFYQNYFSQNGTLVGADQIWREYADQNPVIPETITPVGGGVQSLIDQYAD